MTLLVRVQPPSSEPEAALPNDGLVEADRVLTIGRSPDNDLVLDDASSTISKRHCTISRDEAGFILADQSRNGTLVKRDGYSLRRDAPVLLRRGDIIQVGGYSLVVVSAVATPERTAAVSASQDDEPSFLGAVSPAPSADAHLASFDAVGRAEDARPIIDGDAFDTSSDGLLDDVSAPGRRDVALSPARADHVAIRNMVYVQPRLRTEPIPDDWDIMEDLERPAAASLGPVVSPDLHEPLPVPQPEFGPEVEEASTSIAAAGEFSATSSEDTVAVQAFLDACGLTDAECARIDKVAVMRRAGDMLRVAVENLHAILEARTLTKESFGIERTMLGRSGNNPLKFVADPHDALAAVLLATIPGFTSADEAVGQAFTDVKDHQIAMVAAMQDALARICRQLAPEFIERAAGRPRWRDRVAPWWSAVRFRRAYRHIFEGTVASLDHDARQVFGIGFARHYEDKMASLGLRPARADGRAPAVEPPQRDLREPSGRTQRALDVA